VVIQRGSTTGMTSFCIGELVVLCRYVRKLAVNSSRILMFPGIILSEIERTPRQETLVILNMRSMLVFGPGITLRLWWLCSL